MEIYFSATYFEKVEREGRVSEERQSVGLPIHFVFQARQVVAEMLQFVATDTQSLITNLLLVTA
jgi:hypothetical protein